MSVGEICLFVPWFSYHPVYYHHTTPLIFRLTREDKLKDVVEDVVASGTIWEKLEGLGVVHWSLLLIDLL